MAKRKRKKNAKRLFFTLVLLSVVLYAGFSLGGKLSLFPDKATAEGMTEEDNKIIGENITGNKNNIDKNADDNKDENIGDNKGDDVDNSTGNNADNNVNNNVDSKANNNTGKDTSSNTDNSDKSNNPIGNQSGGAPNKDNSKQLVDNANDILVIVNKQRYLEPNYKPGDLVVPNVKFSFDGEHEKKYMRKEAAQSLEELFGQAYKEGVYIFALSGYRSYNTQKWLFESRANKVGEIEANKLTARPGESEHQTGLAMDITSQSVQFDLKQKFGDTMEGKWVKNNAHRFGFIIRYAKDKVDITGYSYEPWHIRYVGKDAADEIYNRGITLEEYMGRTR